jgi:CheY-like chemotaxis protein
MKYRDILHIDDDEEDQEIFLAAVKTLSLSVRYNSSTDAREALEKLTAKEMYPDAIFLDLNMPVMSGQQFLAEIKKSEELKDIPVIIFSTSSNAGTIQNMKNLGAEEFITKPGSFDQLVNLLKPLLG